MASYVNGTHNDRQEYHNAAAGAQYTENGNSAGKSVVTETTVDEVAWYFVERYYTTLSDKPDQLHVSQRGHGRIAPACTNSMSTDISAVVLQQEVPIRLWQRERRQACHSWSQRK